MKLTTILLVAGSGLLVLVAGAGTYFSFVEEGTRAEARYVSDKITCGACAEKLQAALQPLTGVKQVSVEASARQILVIYDPRSTDPGSIAIAMNGAGYPARLLALENAGGSGSAPAKAGAGCACCAR